MQSSETSDTAQALSDAELEKVAGGEDAVAETGAQTQQPPPDEGSLGMN